MSEWRDIESAPRDGKEVILSIPTDEGVTLVRPGFWRISEGCWKAGYLVPGMWEYIRGNARPTGWMPLPEPPEE